MSADNYFLIRKHPSGGFAAVMGFASDVDDSGSEIEPVADTRHRAYPTVDEAINSAIHEYAEYGISVHPECDET